MTKEFFVYSFFKNWDTKTCLWTGMTFFAIFTLFLVLMRAEKEYVMAGFGLTGQLVAALLTYVNSNKAATSTIVEIPAEKKMEEKEKGQG
jgi:hypothetical protein